MWICPHHFCLHYTCTYPQFMPYKNPNNSKPYISRIMMPSNAHSFCSFEFRSRKKIWSLRDFSLFDLLLMQQHNCNVFHPGYLFVCLMISLICRTWPAIRGAQSMQYYYSIVCIYKLQFWSIYDVFECMFDSLWMHMMIYAN